MFCRSFIDFQQVSEAVEGVSGAFCVVEGFRWYFSSLSIIFNGFLGHYKMFHRAGGALERVPAGFRSHSNEF